MKRFSMAMMGLALAGLMTTVSCRKPVMGFTNGESRTVTVSAVTENGDGSKTAIDGLNVKWSVGDKIKMNGSVLELTEGAGGTMGRFAGEVTGGGSYYIGYPADNTTCAGATVKLSIPAEWTYNVEKQEVPMVAYAANVDDDVYFRNAVNMLKLQLKGDGTDASKLKSIELTSTTSNLSGKIEVTFDEGGNPTFNAIAGDGASKTMTVSFGDGLQLTAEATCVYIPLAKIASNEVLTVRFICAAGKMEKKVTATSAFDAVNNMLSDELTVNATLKEHGYVDLGLPSGTLWATCNVGADSPEGYGDYYAWGEVEPYYTSQSPLMWKEGKTNGYAWLSYCGSDSFAEWDPAPYDAETKVLTSTYDAARANWGGGWRMPTTGEWKELYDNTTSEWTTENGVSGRKFTSTKEGYTDRNIFLPDAGHRYGTKLYNAGFNGHYWSSSFYSSNPAFAYSMSFDPGYVDPQYDNLRYSGFPVRPVR